MQSRPSRSTAAPSLTASTAGRPGDVCLHPPDSCLSILQPLTHTDGDVHTHTHTGFKNTDSQTCTLNYPEIHLQTHTNSDRHALAHGVDTGTGLSPWRRVRPGERPCQWEALPARREEQQPGITQALPLRLSELHLPPPPPFTHKIFLL